MPTSLHLTLDLRGVNNLPEHGGAPLHANFFKWIEAVDAPLAQLIDAGDGPKPFTVSPLSVEADRAGQGVCRITLLDDELYPLLLAGLTRRSVVEIYHQTLPIAAPPEVYARSYEALWTGADRNKHVTLAFDTPTSFKSKELHYTLPDAGLVFGSYLTRWNVFAPPERHVDESWQDWVRQTVAVARFRLESREVRFRGHQQMGCVGVVDYELIRPIHSTDWAAQVFNVLGDYAYFCGTGHKTTQGMGQTHRRRDMTGFFERR
jgi:CRISPR-associated endoribonuclease Cas6